MLCVTVPGVGTLCTTDTMDLSGSARLERTKHARGVPPKQRVTFEDAAHSVAFKQADAVQHLLNETIVPSTYGR